VIPFFKQLVAFSADLVSQVVTTAEHKTSYLWPDIYSALLVVSNLTFVFPPEACDWSYFRRVLFER